MLYLVCSSARTIRKIVGKALRFRSFTNRKTGNFMRCKYAAALLLFFFVQLVGVAPTYASSSWDNVYNTTSSLKVRNDSYGCSYDLDLTNSWQEVINESNAATSFSAALSNGTWGVSQNLNKYNGQRTDVVAVYWTEDSSGHVEFVGDGVNSGFQVIFRGSGANVHVAFIEQKSGACSEAQVYSSYTTVRMTVSTITDSVDYTYGWWNLFVNATVNYPSNYEGEYVPTSQPTPSPTPYLGTIDCGGEDPEYMTIYQAGNNGAATLAPISLGRAEWEYDLRTDVPYSFNVSCGSSLAAAFDPVYVSEGVDWICDIYGTEPYYCVPS